MKKTIIATLVGLAVTFSANALIIGVDVGTNLTNDGTNLVPYTDQPANQNPDTIFDWLAIGGAYDPGQIAQYNAITGSSLGQPTAGDPDYMAANSSNNGNYTFAVGSYYVAAHFGQIEAVWLLVVTNAAETYGFIADINGTGQGNQGGGYSNFRAWAAPTTQVPDSSITFALLGTGLLALVGIRRRLKA